MRTYALRVYVGPTLVSVLACKFQRAGLQVTCEGTAHVHCQVDARDEFDAKTVVLDALRLTYRHTFGITPADVHVLRIVSNYEVMNS